MPGSYVLNPFQRIVEIGGPPVVAPTDVFLLYVRLQWWGDTAEGESCGSPAETLPYSNPGAGYQAAYELKGPPQFPDGLMWGIKLPDETGFTLVPGVDFTVTDYAPVASGGFGHEVGPNAVRSNVYYSVPEYIGLYGGEITAQFELGVISHPLAEPFVLPYPPAYFSSEPIATFAILTPPLLGGPTCFKFSYDSVPRLYYSYGLEATSVAVEHEIDFSAMRVTHAGNVYKPTALQISDNRTTGWGQLIFYCERVVE